MRDIGDTLTTQELQDLADLVAHPGWRLVETMVDREWGAQGFGEKIARTIGEMTPEVTSLAVQHLQQATAAQREVIRVMRWPREQMSKARLTGTALASMNRGGL